MIYSEKATPTKCLASIKVDTSKEISIEEISRMLNDLREAVMTNKPILLPDDGEKENDS